MDYGYTPFYVYTEECIMCGYTADKLNIHHSSRVMIYTWVGSWGLVWSFLLFGILIVMVLSMFKCSTNHTVASTCGSTKCSYAPPMLDKLSSKTTRICNVSSHYHSMIIVIHNMLPSCRGHCSIAYSFIQPCTTTAQKEMWVEKLFNFINRELHFLLCITSVWYFLSICLSIHGAHLVQQITMCTLTVHCYASCIRIVCILLSSLGSLLLHLRKIAVLKNIAQTITPNKWIFYSRSVREIEDDRKL